MRKLIKRLLRIKQNSINLTSTNSITIDPAATNFFSLGLEKKMYRCSNGHEGLEYYPHSESFNVRFYLGGNEKVVYCCPLCLGETLEKLNLPILEEVANGEAIV